MGAYKASKAKQGSSLKRKITVKYNSTKCISKAVKGSVLYSLKEAAKKQITPNASRYSYPVDASATTKSESTLYLQATAVVLRVATGPGTKISQQKRNSPRKRPLQTLSYSDNS
jgi:hypothetical protein